MADSEHETETKEVVKRERVVRQGFAGAPARASSVTVILAHHLDVDANGRPANLSGLGAEETKLPGDTIDIPYADAESLIAAGYVQVDPTDRDAVKKILAG